MVDSAWFRDRKVTVMGLGLFGGGVAATRFLHRLGAKVTVTDLRDGNALAPSLEAIGNLDVRTVLGRHAEADFREADMVVASPAVPPDAPFLKIARDAGVPVESEMNLFFRFQKSACVIGVTGSNGKSTTTSLIGSILSRAGFRTRVGGNIGRPLLEEVFDIGEEDRVVLELSSFQLEDLARLQTGPHIGVLTNVTPNHLDRHGTMGAYVRAKANLFRFQHSGDTAVINADDPVSMGLVPRLTSQPLLFSLEDRIPEGFLLRGDQLVWREMGSEVALLERGDIRIPGLFNVANVLAACAAAVSAGADAGAVREGVRAFSGIPHRLERVAARRGADWYNDSIATTPESTMAALSAFECGIVLIAGGYDKKLDLGALSKAVSKRARVAVLIGAIAPALARSIREAEGGCEAVLADGLDAAVREAASRVRPGEAVLLSPAAASYDMFTNFEERGERFRELVRALD
jgi:UDP-N-acetylmuramoylalanine--D-glutamate ligase